MHPRCLAARLVSTTIQGDEWCCTSVGQVRALAFVAVLTYQVMVALAAAEEAVEAAVAHELTVWQRLGARPPSSHPRHVDRPCR